MRTVTTRRFSTSRAAFLFLLAATAGACSDFAMEPDRVPDQLMVEPVDTLITQGDQAQLRVTVLDQDGQPFTGLPTWAMPQWNASIQGALVIAPDGGLEAVGGGEVYLEARLAGLKARSRVRVNPSEVALSAPTIYLAQAVQTPGGDVPLVAGRMALLRVFVVSNPGSFYQPRARASFFLNGGLAYEIALMPGSDLLGSSVDEQRMERSFNALIPGEVLQPGAELVVELDIDGIVPLAPGSALRIPAEGRTALDVRALPEMKLTVVPTLLDQGPNETIFNWTDGLTETSSAIRYTRTVLPVGEIDVVVHEPYTTSADLTTEDGWSQYLREINLMRVAEGGEGYYYGAVVLPPGSPWGGLGYVGLPAGVGRPTETTLAHELGHNMTLRHAPCGGVASYDRNYPYSGGGIGMWGYSNLGGSGLATLRDPEQVKDLMGYCTPRWVSDYHFVKAMLYRLGAEPFNGSMAAEEAVLLVWGGLDQGRLTLEPAFSMDARPALPSEDGPYRLEASAEGGRIIFSLDFSLTEGSRGGGGFSFAVPVSSDDLEALHALTLTGPEGEVTLDRTTPTAAAALVRDRTSGRIRGILRGEAAAATSEDGQVATVSTGIPSRGNERRR